MNQYTSCFWMLRKRKIVSAQLWWTSGQSGTCPDIEFGQSEILKTSTARGYASGKKCTRHILCINILAGYTTYWAFYLVSFDVNCCTANCHSTECLVPCGAVLIAAFLQFALHRLLVLRPCTFSCRFCLVHCR